MAEEDSSSLGASGFYGFDGDGNAVDEIGQESTHNVEDHQENDDDGEAINDNASQIPSEACSKNPNAQEIQQSELHENVGDMETQGKLPSFTSTFMKVKGATKETSAVGCANTLQQNTPVVWMSTVIHPPGTNAEMQMVMKGRLPSTSGSEADVPEVVEQVMMSRMASTQSSSMPSNTQSRIQASQVFHQQQPVQQSGALMSQSAALSGSQLKVLKAKDQNIMKISSMLHRNGNLLDVHKVIHRCHHCLQSQRRNLRNHIETSKAIPFTAVCISFYVIADYIISIDVHMPYHGIPASFLKILYLCFTDDEEEMDAEPPNDYLITYKMKLRDLARILADVYQPSESYHINEKLADIGRISLFVSFILRTLSF